MLIYWNSTEACQLLPSESNLFSEECICKFMSEKVCILFCKELRLMDCLNNLNNILTICCKKWKHELY
jgi:hypothetical protein